MSAFDSMQHYEYKTPMWGVYMLYSVMIPFFSLCIFAFFGWLNSEPTFVRWFVLVIGIVGLIGSINPRNWKPWRYFYANDEGLHFPSECPETKSTEWLLVPWERVGAIKKDKFRGNTVGPSIELVLQDNEIERFFRNDRKVKAFFGQEIRVNGFYTVGYSNAFQRVDTVVRNLNEIKQAYS